MRTNWKRLENARSRRLMKSKYSSVFDLELTWNSEEDIRIVMRL
jgi:hypothetical protein